MSTHSKPEKYVIRHISGSKANQIDEFAFDSRQEITLGRAATSDVQFDPEQDSVVSREHGKIVKVSDSPFTFKILDNNSRNGIFVNKQRVKAEGIIKPGDEVQLGSNGPSFMFDIYPLPAGMMQATRIIDIPTSVKPTTEMSVSGDRLSGESAEIEPSKPTVGKQTVERMLYTERSNSRKTLVASLAGVLIVLSAVGFAFRDKIFNKTEIHITQTDSTATESKAIIDVEEIAEKYRKSVVKINFAWRLYLTNTNEPLWHEFTRIEGEDGTVKYYPLFVQVSDGSIEPKLTTSNLVPRIPIGMDGASGTGFVVSEDGFILTNSHVATGWNVTYQFNPNYFPGLLVDSYGNFVKDAPPVYQQDVYGWVPWETKQFGYNPTNKTVKGANTYLNATFADKDTPIPVSGEPIPSAEHDVALIKVTPPRKLPYIQIDENSEVKIGAPTVVMGYPGVTPPTFSIVTSKNVFNSASQVREVAKPTTTTGTISNIIEGSQVNGTERRVGSYFGEAYQVQINETGGGNSGGPVINKEGKVIGIYYAGNSAGGATTSYAIPIKYGTKLLNSF